MTIISSLIEYVRLTESVRLIPIISDICFPETYFFWFPDSNHSQGIGPFDSWSLLIAYGGWNQYLAFDNVFYSTELSQSNIPFWVIVYFLVFKYQFLNCFFLDVKGYEWTKSIYSFLKLVNNLFLFLDFKVCLFYFWKGIFEDFC